MIRPATVRDVPAIATLISTYAQRGKMLFRSHAELYETLRDFLVFEESVQCPVSSAQNEDIALPSSGNWTLDTGHSPVLGVAALEIVWSDLAEVRSLAVDPAHHGRGIGKALVTAIIEEARRLQIQRVFALTYERPFFEKLGFHVVDVSALPLKVWSECIRCPKRDGCDEIAMVRTILDTPAVADDDPNTHADLRYEIPTPLTQLRLPRS